MMARRSRCRPARTVWPAGSGCASAVPWPLSLHYGRLCSPASSPRHRPAIGGPSASASPSSSPPHSPSSGPWPLAAVATDSSIPASSPLPRSWPRYCWRHRSQRRRCWSARSTMDLSSPAMVGRSGRRDLRARGRNARPGSALARYRPPPKPTGITGAAQTYRRWWSLARTCSASGWPSSSRMSRACCQAWRAARRSPAAWWVSPRWVRVSAS